jgi:hypothetical protein
MQELSPPLQPPHISGEVDRDEQMQRALDCLEIENVRLKQLVVRLSETIIKNVVAGR